MLGTYYTICESIIEIRLAISLRYGFGQMESQSMENGPFFRVFFFFFLPWFGKKWEFVHSVKTSFQPPLEYSFRHMHGWTDGRTDMSSFEILHSGSETQWGIIRALFRVSISRHAPPYNLARPWQPTRCDLSNSNSNSNWRQHLCKLAKPEQPTRCILTKS